MKRVLSAIYDHVHTMGERTRIEKNQRRSIEGKTRRECVSVECRKSEEHTLASAAKMKKHACAAKVSTHSAKWMRDWKLKSPPSHTAAYSYIVHMRCLDTLSLWLHQFHSWRPTEGNWVCHISSVTTGMEIEANKCCYASLASRHSCSLTSRSSKEKQK